MIEENRYILNKLDDIQDHFYKYLFSKAVRDISLTVKLQNKDWDTLKRLEGQKSLLLGRRNFEIEEIYLLIIPFTAFVLGAQKEIIPNLGDILDKNSLKLSLGPQEKSIRRLLVNNFSHNIVTLGTLVLELYELIVIEDLKVNKTPLCLSMASIKKIEDDLSFIG